MSATSACLIFLGSSPGCLPAEPQRWRREGDEEDEKVSLSAADAACKTLLGGGTSLAKDLLCQAQHAKQLTVTSDPDGNRFWCGLESTSDGHKGILFTSDIDGLNRSIESAAQYDSGTKTHITTTDTGTGIGALITEVPVQSAPPNEGGRSAREAGPEVNTPSRRTILGAALTATTATLTACSGGQKKSTSTTPLSGATSPSGSASAEADTMSPVDGFKTTVD